MLIRSTLLRLVSGSASIEKYEFLSKTYQQDSYLLLCTDCLYPSKISTLQAYKMRDWLKWVNVNIILQLGDASMSETRLGVLMRHACSMLDKVSCVDDITRLCMFCNLRHNVWEEYYNIRSEGLPF